MKASDFDNISKEILAPFPDSVAAETRLAKEACHGACQIKGVNVNLTSSVVKMPLKRTSHVRGELKTKMRSLTGPFYGFRTIFVFKDWSSKKGICKTELLQESINLMWFTNRNDEGVIYHKYFNPMPVKVVALVLTAELHFIECCIDEWLKGLQEDIKFTSATMTQLATFHAGVESLIMSSATPYIDDKAFEDATQSLHRDRRVK
ncbi:hypothetical protein AZE42_00244 [Rhizopogon vesiculosus]|uniref:DUF6532 domain-containing protein n=1 Tax=Rhizopogon vesiculosus TaxID=180088 RepID=A0A1J8QZR3_9AGAM|nr:hypothetical protein AZE42_00244 [Rhizopogon vesiculosus]